MYVTSAAWTDGLTIGGVDTHRDTHHAAVIDQVGRHLADAEFPATPAGYRHLLEWLAAHGRLERVGVEGTGAYGAALTRFLRERESPSSRWTGPTARTVAPAASPIPSMPTPPPARR